MVDLMLSHLPPDTVLVTLLRLSGVVIEFLTIVYNVLIVDTTATHLVEDSVRVIL